MREYWLDPPELPDPPECPVCKCQCETYIMDINGDIVGCESCTREQDAYEYQQEQEELEADYYRETFMSDK